MRKRNSTKTIEVGEEIRKKEEEEEQEDLI
jgi:hypothetical protein